MAEAVGFLFCGKATAVATCHRQLAKSRLSNPPKYQKYDRHPYRAPVKFLAEAVGFEPTVPFTGLLDFESRPL